MWWQLINVIQQDNNMIIPLQLTSLNNQKMLTTRAQLKKKILIEYSIDYKNLSMTQLKDLKLRLKYSFGPPFCCRILI